MDKKYIQTYMSVLVKLYRTKSNKIDSYNPNLLEMFNILKQIAQFNDINSNKRKCMYCIDIEDDSEEYVLILNGSDVSASEYHYELSVKSVYN